MDRMRSPENRAGQRAARRLEEELSLKYLSPGAFTILSPHEYGTNPDPPTAPTQYRLTPTSTRRRIQAFSIIAEASSNPASRSPSPTGRVSPFRGRGFNPIGSRHASPNPSPPPPEEQRTHQPTRPHTNQHHHPPSSSPRRSQIPQPTRKGSTSNIFGDHVTQDQGRRPSTNLSPQFSQSMTNMTNITNISGRKGRNRRPAFEQLSPITGSSPETTSIGKKSQSSPCRIPMSSRSQPVSRRSSPSRGREYSNQSSRAGSRSTSRNNSRSSSPTKGYSRIPVKNAYREVSAKVNTFNKSKPKVPPKPQELKHGSSGSSNGSSNRGSSNKGTSNKGMSNKGSSSQGSSSQGSNNKGRLSRKASEVKLKASGGGGTNLNGTDDRFNRTDDRSNRTDDAEDARTDQQRKEGAGHVRNESQKSNSSNKSSQTTKSSNTNGAKLIKDQNIDEITILEKGAPNEPEEDAKKPELQSRGSSSKLDTTVVSSTTKTAVQPLKMDEDLENSLREERSKAGYLNEDRILSATSVSNAMNKMNDSVLNSQTLLGDQNFGMRSPANTIISMSNDQHHGSMSNIMGNKVVPPRSATTTLPTIESIHKQLDGVGQNINSSFSDSNKVYMESIESTVKNNITKANTPDHVRGFVQKSVNDRIIDARTLVSSDVKPIKILVKGRPEDVEVQSGNTRLPSSATNGLSGSPSLPPAEVHQNATNQHEEVPPPKTTCCSRLFSRCKCKKPLCKKWKKKKTTGNDIQPIKKSKSSLSCFNCRKKKKQDEDKSSTSTAPIEGNEPTNQKPSCWNRLKCCKSKRVGDTGCCPRSKRKDSWVDNKENVRNDGEQSKPSCKNRCKNAFRSIFCCACCVRKKKVEVEVRRESMISSKKKSLTPTSVPPVDTRPKIDISLVEHGSVMKGAIPVLPVPMAWICLICNIFLPGIGTVLSGMFCLCVGKPRFSQNDGPRPRIGAFIIDLIIGCGQLFTVLFCLVGWGWSIWWGVIMLKVAKKNKRIKLVEARAQGQVPVVADNHRARDAERGS